MTQLHLGVKCRTIRSPEGYQLRMSLPDSRTVRMQLRYSGPALITTSLWHDQFLVEMQLLGHQHLLELPAKETVLMPAFNLAL